VRLVGDRAPHHHKDGDHHAPIGRSIRNFDIGLMFPSPEEKCGLGVTRVPSLSFCGSFDYRLASTVAALVNNPHRPDRLAGLYGAHTDFVIAADNCT